MYCIQVCKIKELKMIISLKNWAKTQKGKVSKNQNKSGHTQKRYTLKKHYNWYFIKLHKPYMQEILEEIDCNTMVINSFLIPLTIEHKIKRT